MDATRKKSPSLDDIQGHMNHQTRDDKGDDLDTAQDISQNSSSSVITEDVTDHKDSTVPMTVEESYSNRRELEKLEWLKYRDDLNELDDYISKLSVFPSDKTDIQLWIPPEPECTELDIDSVADNDDDEYCNDGTVWGQPSSLNSLDDEFGNSRSIKEARKKAMLEATNNQLSILINRLLALEGINIHDNKSCDNWLNMVTRLSWEAASLIKPDASEGGAMDPTSYLKIKCLASGTPSQSQVVKGLVFKKTTAHKHMPTKLKNPRLLLIQGSLGHSATSLSSFKSMGQEEGYKKTFLEMIDLCNPNVILVENTVSRDIQGVLLDKGIALIVDMKISRLQRIARATGSQIIVSENVTMVPKLKQCEYFHVEKLIEEHNTAGEGGKKPSKTLMFLEGCPRPLGCTILLKGSHQYVLKRIKHVLQYAVFAAYHLILETSFISDQRTFFYNKKTRKELNDTLKNNSVSSASECALAADNIINSTFDIPISSISIESSSDENKSFDEESLQPLNHEKLQSCISTSMINLVKNKLPHFKTDSVSSCFGVSEALPHLSPRSSVTSDHEEEEKEKIKEERFITEAKIDGMSDFENALDPQSILILVSAYNVPKQMVCEQPHLSRIEYYGNFDTSLGRYLQNNILSEKHICTCCGELPEKHVYRYTHQNGNLSVLVNRLGKIYTLPGEAEGKIWMWTRCLKCEHESGNPKQTRRVAMSSAAHNLSFGKFLELSFSSRFSDSRISKCGHFLYRDCLRFFGLGTKVALFQYTPVEIYAVCRPPVMLQFCNPSEQEWFSKEASYVISEGDRLFEEIKRLLKKLEPRFSSTEIRFSEIEVILRREKNEFEACLKDTRQNVHANLSWSMQELLLLLYMWDYRLHSFFPDNRDGESSDNRINEERNEKNREGSIQESGNDIFPLNYVHRDEHDMSSDADSRSENAVSLESSNRPSTDGIAVSIPITSDHSEEDSSVPVIIGTFDDDHIISDIRKWFWPTFSELRTELKNDLHGGYLQKYEFVNTYLPAHLSPMRQIATRLKDTLHFVCSGSVMSVISDEISSIIACALFLSDDDDDNDNDDNNNNNNSNGDKSADAKRENMAGSHISSSRSFSSLTADELAILGSDGSLFSDRGKPVENRHPEISVGLGKDSGKSRYSVVSIYAKEFSHLRSRCCSSEMAYISSLSRCKKWDAQGGKSKVLFAKTMDDRFIIKQVKKTELESFLKFGPDYFKYMTYILDSGSQSCLAKILGIYQVKQYQNGREIKTDVVVMENLFFGRNITRKYDLKGAVFARYISDSNDSESVFLDENFVQDMHVSPIYIGGRNKHLLQRAIWNDTSFLTSINVMDYSLLVGVDKEKREIVFGIIDYLRQYTWDKQLETWVKASLVVPKNELPTVISPKDYRKRFRTFMTKYFLTIPDSWKEKQDKAQNIL